MVTDLVGADVEAVAIGVPVEVFFDDVFVDNASLDDAEPAFTLPRFRLTAPSWD